MTAKAPAFAPVEEKQLVCNQGYVLRQREWASYDDECLGTVCPHPVMCPLKQRKEREQ